MPKVMKIADAFEFCKQLTYKPNYAFSFTMDQLSSVPDSRVISMSIAVVTEDAYDGEEILFSPIGGIIYPSRSLGGFDKSLIYGQVLDIIARFEQHERLEWLRVDNRPVINPHNLFGEESND